MNQTKLGSFYESAINVLIGAMVAITSQYLVFPLFGIEIPLSSHIGITCWFTAISVIRSYVIRRWFNARLRQAAIMLSGGDS